MVFKTCCFLIDYTANRHPLVVATLGDGLGKPAPTLVPCQKLKTPFFWVVSVHFNVNFRVHFNVN